MKGEMNEMGKGGMKGRHGMKGGCKGHGKGMHRGHAMENEEYAYVREVELGFDETVKRVKEELKKEGFGVLSEIKVDELFKEKLDLDMEPYVILGACNPKFSSELIGIDMDSGTFLPCNLVVYVKEGKTYVSLLLPTKAMSITGNDELLEVAAKVEEILKGVVDRV